MTSSENIGEIRNQIKEMIVDTDREILREIENEEYWILTIKHGSYIVNLIHPKRSKYMVVEFPFRIEDEKVLAIIKNILQDPMKGGQFFFSLKSAISSPTTAYRLHHSQDGNFIGFSILKRIFPFHENFTIKDLDESIQAVVSIGVLGLTFLSIIIGVKELEQRIIEETQKPPPDGMYG